jgi:hypothetical protein
VTIIPNPAKDLVHIAGLLAAFGELLLIEVKNTRLFTRFQSQAEVPFHVFLGHPFPNQ